LPFSSKENTQTQTKDVRALNDKILVVIGPPNHQEEKKFGGDKRDQGESASLFFSLARAFLTKFYSISVLRDLFSLLSLRYFFQLLESALYLILTSLSLSLSFENEQTSVDAGRSRLRKSSHGQLGPSFDGAASLPDRSHRRESSGENVRWRLASREERDSVLGVG
jgi:hypothetical protein